jgi:hypothetical protein
MNLSPGDFYAPKYCFPHRSSTSRQIMSRQTEWSFAELEERIPGYLEKLQKFIQAGNMLHFSVLPYGENHGRIGKKQAPETIILEDYVSQTEASLGVAHCFSTSWKTIKI